MPSRKKDRGKHRKAAKQRSGGDVIPLGGGSEPVLRPQEAEHAIREFKELGCRVIRGDDGRHTIQHPCRRKLTASDLRNFDRGLLNDKQRQELAQNYVHNYAQDLREGGLHGMDVIVNSIADPHIGEKLVEELLKSDVHLSFLHFLNQSSVKSMSDVLSRGVDVDESVKLSRFWLSFQGLFVQHRCSDNAQEDARHALAKGMEPFVMAMVDSKRELFRSNHIWHVCLSPFFRLMPEILKSKEAFLAMMSYEGLLPFVAQASCWSHSREDIVEECRLLRQRRLEPITTPEPILEVCDKAQKLIVLIIHVHADVVDEVAMSKALGQIARTPLLSNDPECNDSTVVGLIRTMNTANDEQRRILLWCIIEPLLLKHGYVDAQVIAELIEYGRRNSSKEIAETVLKTMVSILGLDNSYEQIQQIDSRYAAAVRHGLMEYCIDFFVSYGDCSDFVIAEGLHFIAFGLCSMAMHSKTSRALRKRKVQIVSALDSLRTQSTPQSEKICTVISDAIDASATATCCNCVKEIDRKKLLFCQRCNIECYCSPACQSESFALGHDKRCKEEVQFFDTMREEGLSESERKRLAVLSNNLMMNGCRLVKRKMAEMPSMSVEMAIDFGQYPPDIKVTRNDTGEYSGSLKCTFVSPVDYGFAEKVDLDEVVLKKVFPRSSLAPMRGAK